MGVIALLQHWYWLLREPAYRGLRGYAPRASWRVEYADGVSAPMPYGNAVEYAQMFGGTVVRTKERRFGD